MSKIMYSGEAVRTAMRRLGVTQQQLVALTGADRNSVGNWVRNGVPTRGPYKEIVISALQLDEDATAARHLQDAELIAILSERLARLQMLEQAFRDAGVDPAKLPPELLAILIAELRNEDDSASKTGTGESDISP